MRVPIMLVAKFNLFQKELCADNVSPGAADTPGAAGRTPKYPPELTTDRSLKWTELLKAGKQLPSVGAQRMRRKCVFGMRVRML